MMSAPMNPAINAVQRRSRTFSPRMRIASTVANSGAVNPSACTTASGVIESAMKNITMATTLLDARSMCSPKRFVRSGPRPCVANQGMSTRKPKKLRKNATSKG